MVSLTDDLDNRSCHNFSYAFEYYHSARCLSWANNYRQMVMLQKVTLLFCLLFYSLNGTYISSFTDEIVWGSVKTDCDFDLSYTDSNFTKTNVSCRISKGKMTVDYIHEAKSMHILTLKLRISKSGKTKVLSSSVEKSK